MVLDLSVNEQDPHLTSCPNKRVHLSRYVDTSEPLEVTPVEEALAKLWEAERRRDEPMAGMDGLLAEMGHAR